MKTTLLLIGLMLSTYGWGQTFREKFHMAEKSVMKEKHIDFSKEVIFFDLHGTIEIDGHLTDNDKSKCPIMYYANLDEVTLIDTCTNTKYVHRKCNRDKCKIIHLSIKQTTLTEIDPHWQFQLPYQEWEMVPGLITDTTWMQNLNY